MRARYIGTVRAGRDAVTRVYTHSDKCATLIARRFLNGKQYEYTS